VFGKGECERKEGRRSRQEKDGDRQLRMEGRKEGRKEGKKGKEEGSKQGWIKQKEGNKEARGRLRAEKRGLGTERERGMGEG